MSRKRTIEEIKQLIKNTTHCELLSTEYINQRTKMKFLCECGDIFETTLASIQASNKQYCNKCSNKKMHDKFAKTQEQFEKELHDKLGDKYVLLSRYINTNTKVLMKHLECGNTWEVTPSSMLNQNTKCPFCCGNRKKTTTQFKKEVYELVGNEYDVLSEYINAKKPILMRHNKCGNKWWVQPTNFLTYHSCVFCSPRSRGEDRISEILKKNNIQHEREKRFDGCKNQKKLPFDFYLNNLNVLIEYDGVQHFKPSFNEKEFKNIKVNDEIKNKFCEENNIKLIRIPYWEFENIETILEGVIK